MYKRYREIFYESFQDVSGGFRAQIGEFTCSADTEEDMHAKIDEIIAFFEYYEKWYKQRGNT